MTFEEWWGRVFEKRGTIAADQMPDSSPATIRKLATVDILELIRSEGDRSVRGLLCLMERRRREEWTARAALVVSIVALAIAAVT